jgi:hypothetical protein
MRRNDNSPLPQGASRGRGSPIRAAAAPIGRAAARVRSEHKRPSARNHGVTWAVETFPCESKAIFQFDSPFSCVTT